MSRVIEKPAATEYAQYYGKYVDKVASADVVGFLEQQRSEMSQLIRGIDEAKGGFRYETGKWSIKELLGHVIDAERVFAYRALVFARNDKTALPGFDQDPWVHNSNYTNLKIGEIAAEFDSVRLATIVLFKHMDASAFRREGMANGDRMTARAAAFVIAGHAQHHVDVLRSRYLL
jgi:hypothetical protein